jgi:hypothetical protein
MASKRRILSKEIMGYAARSVSMSAPDADIAAKCFAQL